MRIRDVVTPNPRAVFANDVQLSWYPFDERNLPLVQAYMFADKAPQGPISSCELLEKLYRSFLWVGDQGDDNRHVLIATYGRGKTHLALALANLFGKRGDSPEVLAALANFEHSAGAARAQNLRDFKAGRPPQLVIRLRGDQPQGLHQQFLVGLERALAEHPHGLPSTLPFWHQSALDFLKRLDPGHRARADAFLAAHTLDVAQLEKQVGQRIPDAHDLSVRTHQALFGTIPDFGGEVSLQKAVEWAVQEFCSGDQPRAGGLFIIFDEFSAFIKRYAQSRDISNSSSLQDLLNGVRNCPRQAVFLALTQSDPSTVARHIEKHLSQHEIDDLEKELSRLPKSHRYTFHSSMETVLKAYLSQDEAALSEIMERGAAAVVDASEDTVQLFSPRYDSQSGWGIERFEDVVTRGCFPLHPLTTALFCSTEFAETESARTVLNFVLTELQRKLDEPVLMGDRPNWIYPVSLVDWFGEMLGGAAEGTGKTVYADYQQALTQLGGDITPLQAGVLKAVLLFQTGRLKLGSLRFERVVHHMTGFPLPDCRATLEDLVTRGLLRQDSGRYTFWPAGAGAAFHVEQLLKRELVGMQLDWTLLSKLNQETGALARLRPIEVDMKGRANALDWAAPEKLLTREFFTAKQLRTLAPEFRLDLRNGLQDGVRGCVIWLVAESDEDLKFFHANADSILAEAFGSDPIPVVLAIPTSPRPQLRINLLRELILQNLDIGRKKDLGVEACSSVQQRASKAVEEDLGELRRSAEYIVPNPLRAIVQRHDAQQDLHRTLEYCYQWAYRKKPESFLTQYQMDKRPIRIAVSLLSKLLAGNSVAKNESLIKASPVATDLVSRILLVGGSGNWGLLTHTREIQEPASSHVKHAWDYLEAAFAPGKPAVPVKDVLLPLLNAPYGYDYNQLSLLFCAWCGFHGHELDIRSGSGNTDILECFSNLDVPRNFINRVCAIDQVRISRIDRASAEKEIEALIQQSRQERLTVKQANEARRRLEEYANEERNNPKLRKGASDAAEALKSALAVATAYATGVEQFQNAFQAATTVERLLPPLYNQISNLPRLARVRDDSWPTSAELTRQVDEAVAKTLEGECKRLEELKHLTEYTFQEQKLRNLSNRLEKHGITKGATRVAAALERLQANRKKLEAAQRDSEIRGELRLMHADRGLAELRKSLERLAGFEPEAESTRTDVEKRRKEIETAVSRTTAWVTGLTAEIEAVKTPNQARELAARIQRRHQELHDTPEQAIVDQALERVTQLEHAFRELDTLQKRELTSRAAAEQVLELIRNERDTAALHLGEQQKPLYDAATSTVQARLGKLEAEALRWLEDLENAAASLSAIKLLARLEQVPPFLPAAAYDRLGSLQAIAAAKQETERAEAERRQRDSAIRERVAAINEKRPLRELRAGLEYLREVAPEAEATRQLVAGKRASVEHAIAQAEQRVGRYRIQLDAATSLPDVKKLHAELQRAYHEFAEAPEQAELDAFLARCAQLEGYYSSLGGLRSTELQNPQQVTELEEKLTAMAGEALAFTSGEQRAAVESVRAAIRDSASKRVEQAQGWLQDQERRLQKGGDPEALLRQLDAPPAFLPPIASGRLEDLRNAAREARDTAQRLREQRAREEALRKTIASIVSDGPLTWLREQVVSLEAMRPESPETVEAIRNKLEALRKSIEQAERHHDGLLARLGQARSAGDARKLLADLRAAGERFRGTPEGAALLSAQGPCEQLEAILGQFELLAAKPLEQEDQAAEHQSQIANLGTNVDPALATAIEAARATALASLKRKVAERERQAEEWLQRQEVAAENEKRLDELQLRLMQSPAFLPAHGVERLQTLRMQIRERIDGDAVQSITSQFRRIQDQQKRAQCLVALQLLAAELDGP